VISTPFLCGVVLRLQVEACSRGRQEEADMAVKAFEPTQSLRQMRDTADYVVKRRILEILCLNIVLNDVTLVPTMRKPFDVLVEGGTISRCNFLTGQFLPKFVRGQVEELPEAQFG